MTNFDIPNESELNPYKVYDYDLVDSSYPIEDNQSHGVYDQFLWLRDTLVKSWKKYSWKAGSKLVIWETEDTVEVIWNNKFKMSFEPNWKTNPQSINIDSLWPYVYYDPTIYLDPAFWPLSCKIQQTGRYRIVHKAEVVNIPDSVTQVYARIEYYPIDGNGLYPSSGTPIAVFDWMCNKTITGTTSWTAPNWSCRIAITMWKLFNKITTFGYNERTLNKWDILVLKITDQSNNDLTLQANSNFLSVELTDLIVKKR